jgi:GT2 family glycosyltransferase
MGWAERRNDAPRNTPEPTRRVPLIQRPGLIAVLSGDRATLPDFAACLTPLQRPEGSRFLWRTAGGGGLADGRNRIMRAALASDAGWVFCLDDDHTFAPDVLLRLLRHDLDLVQPLVLMRVVPYNPTLFHTLTGEAITPEATDADMVRILSSSVPTLIKPGARGLIEVNHCGGGGLLVSREVLESMPDPWFELGRLNRVHTDEDVWFCAKARRLGFSVWGDLDTRIGHLTQCCVWPTMTAAGLEAEILTDWSKTTIGEDPTTLGYVKARPHK